MSESSGGCGCCFWPFIFGSIFAAWAVAFGISTPWGVINVNLFPPSIIDKTTPAEWPAGAFSTGFALIAGAALLIVFAVKLGEALGRAKRRRFQDLDR